MSSLGIFIPKGLCRIAQGCREAATLGEKTLQCLTPKGFRIDNTALRNPFRVEQIIAVTPRVAAARQPWAILQKPFGLFEKRRNPLSDNNPKAGLSLNDWARQKNQMPANRHKQKFRENSKVTLGQFL